MNDVREEERARDRPVRGRRPVLATGRVEAFSDGVFAVAITLLVLNLQVPASIDGHGDLVRDLLAEWPAYLSLVVSFATVGIIWINHHAVMTLVEGADRTLLLLNLLLLLAAVLMPFPTELVGRALESGHGERVAVVVYNATSILMSVGFAGVFTYATRSPHLRHPLVTDEYLAWLRPRFLAGNIAYAVALGLAFVVPVASLLLDLAVAVYYAMIRVEVERE